MAQLDINWTKLELRGIPLQKISQLLCVAYPKSTILELTADSLTTGERLVCWLRL